MLLLVGCGPEPAPVDPFADLPNVTFDYYRVSGSDAASIRKSMHGHGTIGADDKRVYDAVTKWRITWKWDGDGKGGCRLDAARIDLKSVVRLPQLDRVGVPGETLADWDRYDAALRAHEAGHVRIAREHLPEVLAAIRGATCATANAAGQAALDRIREANRAYDRETRHGVRTGAVFPQP